MGSRADGASPALDHHNKRRLKRRISLVIPECSAFSSPQQKPTSHHLFRLADFLQRAWEAAEQQGGSFLVPRAVIPDCDTGKKLQQKVVELTPQMWTLVKEITDVTVKMQLRRAFSKMTTEANTISSCETLLQTLTDLVNPELGSNEQLTGFLTVDDKIREARSSLTHWVNVAQKEKLNHHPIVQQIRAFPWYAPNRRENSPVHSPLGNTMTQTLSSSVFPPLKMSSMVYERQLSTLSSNHVPVGHVKDPADGSTSGAAPTKTMSTFERRHSTCSGGDQAMSRSKTMMRRLTRRINAWQPDKVHHVNKQSSPHCWNKSPSIHRRNTQDVGLFLANDEASYVDDPVENNGDKLIVGGREDSNTVESIGKRRVQSPLPTPLSDGHTATVHSGTQRIPLASFDSLDSTSSRAASRQSSADDPKTPLGPALVRKGSAVPTVSFAQRRMSNHASTSGFGTTDSGSPFPSQRPMTSVSPAVAERQHNYYYFPKRSDTGNDSISNHGSPFTPSKLKHPRHRFRAIGHITVDGHFTSASSDSDDYTESLSHRSDRRDRARKKTEREERQTKSFSFIFSLFKGCCNHTSPNGLIRGESDDDANDAVDLLHSPSSQAVGCTSECQDDTTNDTSSLERDPRSDQTSSNMLLPIRAFPFKEAKDGDEQEQQLDQTEKISPPHFNLNLDPGFTNNMYYRKPDALGRLSRRGTFAVESNEGLEMTHEGSKRRNSATRANQLQSDDAGSSVPPRRPSSVPDDVLLALSKHLKQQEKIARVVGESKPRRKQSIGE